MCTFQNTEPVNRASQSWHQSLTLNTKNCWKSLLFKLSRQVTFSTRETWMTLHNRERAVICTGSSNKWYLWLSKVIHSPWILGYEASIFKFYVCLIRSILPSLNTCLSLLFTKLPFNTVHEKSTNNAISAKLKTFYEAMKKIIPIRFWELND